MLFIRLTRPHFFQSSICIFLNVLAFPWSKSHGSWWSSKSIWLLKASAASTAEHHTTHATCECIWEWPRSDLKLLCTSLPHWLESSFVCSLFLLANSRTNFVLFEEEKQMWRLMTAAHSPSCTSSPSVPPDSSWLLITLGQEMVYKKLKSFFVFRKWQILSFSNKLFQSHLPLNQNAVCS